MPLLADVFADIVDYYKCNFRKSAGGGNERTAMKNKKRQLHQELLLESKNKNNKNNFSVILAWKQVWVQIILGYLLRISSYTSTILPGVRQECRS